MKVVEKGSQNKEITNDILKIGVDARNACKTNPKAVNATVGMLYLDNGDFTVFNSVMDTFNSLAPEEFLPYSSTAGGEDFNRAIAKWILRDHLDYYNTNFNYMTIATPGGSGALSSTLENYLERGDDVIIPSIFWEPYLIMAREQEVGTVKYNLFDSNGNFDLSSFKTTVETTAKKQNKVVVIINDPCQNPTGYTLSKNEWEQVITILNEQVAADVPTVLLYDMAYVDYHKDGLDASREVFEVFKNAHQNLLIMCSFSGSKTLSFYGVRIGAMFAISKNAEIVDEFKRVVSYSSRGRWSSSSHIGIRTFVRIMEDEKIQERFESELNEVVSLMRKRGEIFVSEAKECGLEILPYKSGFFITLPNCSKKVFEKLMEHDIYTIPMPGNLVRFAISSVPTYHIEGLAKRVKDIKDSL